MSTQDRNGRGDQRTAKEMRARERIADGYGRGGKVQWGRRALAAYTWFWTGKGPQQ